MDSDEEFDNHETRGHRQIMEDFIECYQEHPCLWKVNSKDYHNRSKRTEAYKELIKILRKIEPTATEKSVVKKINNIRSTYRKEQKKVKDSIMTGLGVDEIYKPKLWYFSLMEFLNDQHTPCPSVSTHINDDLEVQIEEELEDDAAILQSCQTSFEGSKFNIRESRDSDSSDQNISPHVTTGDRNIHTRVLHQNNIGRLPKRSNKDLTNEVRTTNDNFKRPRNDLEDKYDVFGRNVSIKLRSVLDKQRLLAEKYINDILFEAEMGTLEPPSRRVSQLFSYPSLLQPSFCNDCGQNMKYTQSSREPSNHLHHSKTSLVSSQSHLLHNINSEENNSRGSAGPISPENCSCSTTSTSIFDNLHYSQKN